jgi:hypothetical protein
MPSALDHFLELTTDSELDLLETMLGAIDAPELMRLSRVCKRWARAAEAPLQLLCERQQWQQPRRARLQKLSSLELKWRTLFVARACRACFQALGDFAVRSSPHASPCLLLCKPCCKAPPVVRMLQQRHLTLDVTGLSGRALYTAKGDKFCSDVSRLSEAALANASGARAERQRRGGGRGRRR